MKWAFKWNAELRTGQYYDLLTRGFFDKRPDDIAPEIAGLDFYLDAFRELGTCRPGGMDLMPIPFTAIIEYSRIYELDDFDDFFYIIRLLDNTFMDLNDEKNKKAGKEKNGGTESNKNNKNRR